MSIEQLLRARGIDFRRGPAPNVRRGWIGIHCPHCPGSRQFHCGTPAAGAPFFVCWRCGRHSTFDTLQRTLHTTRHETARLIHDYEVIPHDSSRSVPLHDVFSQRSVTLDSIELPRGVGALRPSDRLAWGYLRDRGFDPARIVSTWGLRWGGQIGRCAFRIVAPFTLGGEIVAWQARDVTGRSDIRYLSSGIETKATLYGIDNAAGLRKVVVVEGITDAWRMGPGAVATCGIKYTEDQLALLVRFEEVLIAFDSEDEQAIEQADSMQEALTVIGTQASVVELSVPDPASMTDDEAEMVMCELGFNVQHSE